MKRSSRESFRVAVAAGGTGGHIMPALALAEALQNIGHPVETDFICGNRPVEREIYAQAGVSPRIFPVGAITAKGAIPRTWQAVGLGYSFVRSLLMMRRYDVVVGMGGYITGPVLSAALMCRVPIVLHDSNTVLGRVNRIMAPKAKVIACGMPLIDAPKEVDPARIVETGTPVRLSISKGDRVEAAAAMYLQPGAFTLFICGGSQGAGKPNALAAEAIGRLAHLWPRSRPLQVIWATGPRNVETVRAALQNQPIRGQLFIAPTIERMDHAYAMADLVISRAGGSTLAEIMMCGLPSILFPLPHAVGRHQHHNARVLERHSAAVILDEIKISGDDLARQIMGLALNPERLAAMGASARRLACPDAARDLARIVVETAIAAPPAARA
ncbi:MAG TPA: UDP-N-acetylglucosamine--N-acetylmuramyl-(pentapeptide) pyrophosphoryl-undecaprenol N-acetylglucosamine transferase [Sumerlaeia bacterium]|nr:UDP-N-acetylglucosamine--N-acetylmuramyl-(pentapeptide) pyrophosphoryl-undecaprenol N-acetylglucosamine transferase [Sumerlaeia bacterium]